MRSAYSRTLLVLSVVMSIASLGGCSTVTGIFGKDKSAKSAQSAPAIPVENRIKLGTAWQTRLYGFWRPDPYQSTQLAVNGDHIVMGDSRGDLYALNTHGRERWRRHVGIRVSAGPSIIGDRIYVGTDSGDVVALSLEKGQVLWRSPLSSEVLTRVVDAGGQLVVQTNDGKVWSLNPQNGASQLLYAATVPTLSLRGIATPVYEQGTIYAAFANGEMAALDAKDGHVLWQSAIATPRGRSELERLVDADATPVFFGGDIIAGTYQGKLASLNRGSGAESWSRDMSVYNPLLIDQDRLYLSDADGVLWALDPRTGATLWRNDSLKGRIVTGPSLVQGLITLGDNEGYVYTFDPESGRLFGRARFGLTGIQNAPTPLGNGALVLSQEGTLYRITLSKK